MMHQTQRCRISFTKSLIALAYLSLLSGAAALADETIYHIFANGLECEQCAARVGAQLRAIEGVERVDILSDRGVVNVRMADGYVLVEDEITKLLADAGVKFRRMEDHAAASAKSEYQENSL